MIPTGERHLVMKTRRRRVVVGGGFFVYICIVLNRPLMAFLPHSRPPEDCFRPSGGTSMAFDVCNELQSALYPVQKYAQEYLIVAPVGARAPAWFRLQV